MNDLFIVGLAAFGLMGLILQRLGYFDDLPEHALKGPLVIATEHFLNEMGWGSEPDAEEEDTGMPRDPEPSQTYNSMPEGEEGHVLNPSMPRDRDTNPPSVLAYEHVTHEGVRVYNRLQRRGTNGRFEKGWVLVEETEDD